MCLIRERVEGRGRSEKGFGYRKGERVKVVDGEKKLKIGLQSDKRR